MVFYNSLGINIFLLRLYLVFWGVLSDFINRHDCIIALKNVELLIVRKLYVKDFYHIFMLSFFCVCFLH